MARCVLYLRQSDSDGEGEHSLSLDSQERLLREQAVADGDVVIAVLREPDLKGWQDELARVKLAEALALARQRDFDKLRVYDLRRFARSLRIQEQLVHEFAEHGVKVISYKEPWSSEPLFRQIIGAIAEEETRIISSHIKRTLHEKVLRGLAIGPYAPYGYRRPDPKGALVVCPEEAAIVLEIADRYLVGETLMRIALDLTRRGVPSPGGTSWQYTAVGRILRDRIYRGEIRYKGEWYPGIHPPIGEPSLWEAVDEQRAIRGIGGRRAPKAKRHPSWVEGLIEHACGAAMYLIPPYPGVRSRTFRCDRRARRDRGECGLYPAQISARRVELAVKPLLLDLLAGRFSPEESLALARAEHEQIAPLADRRRRDLVEQLDRLQTRRSRAEELYLSGSRDRAWFDAQDAQITSEVAAVEAAIGVLPAPVDEGAVLELGERLIAIEQAIAVAQPDELATVLRLVGVLIVESASIRLDVRNERLRPHLRMLSAAIETPR